MTKSQYDHWLREGDGVLYEQPQDFTELEDFFEVPKTANWLLIFNDGPVRETCRARRSQAPSSASLGTRNGA